MADFVVKNDEHLTLCTVPLGACLCLAIYDPVAKAAGILHSMLPDSSIDPVRGTTKPGMFLDTGLAALLKEAERFNMKRENLRVFAAGGGRILDDGAYFNIGQRNFEALEKLLAAQGLKLEAHDVGGLANRSLRLNVATGEVRLKISGQSNEKILCKP